MGETKPSDYKVGRDFDERAQIERIFFSFIPHVETIRGVSDAKDLLPHAGVSAPLCRAVGSLVPIYSECVKEHLRDDAGWAGEQPAESPAERQPVLHLLKRKMRPFDHAKASFLSGDDAAPRLVARAAPAEPAQPVEPAEPEGLDVR